MASDSSNPDFHNTATNDTIESSDKEPFSGLLTDSQTALAQSFLIYALQPMTLVFGLITNSLNIIIYKKIGLTDSISIAFLSLSMSDLTFLLIHSANQTMYFYLTDWLNQINGFHDVYVDKLSLGVLSMWYASVAYDFSLLTTLFISIQRCCCITLPFRFRSVFTPTRSVVIILCIFAYTLASYMPVLINQRLQTIPINGSRSLVVLWYGEDMNTIQAVFDIMNRIIVPSTAQILIFACLIILSFSLLKASNFRKSAASIGHKTNTENLDRKSMRTKTLSGTPKNSMKKSKDSDESQRSSVKQSNKEIKVIKSVCLVSVMFLVCNLPANVLYVAQKMVPGFAINGIYSNVYILMYTIRSYIEYLSASCNIFVYYKHNTRFKMIFNEMMSSFKHDG